MKQFRPFIGVVEVAPKSAVFLMSARQVLVLFGVCSALFCSLEASQISYRKFPVIYLKLLFRQRKRAGGLSYLLKTELRISDF